jgi:hypothetical protein
MKVFISWSGERSRAVAEALHDWLPSLIQAVQPWMSSNDIEKGTRWRSGLANELEQASVSIICLTPENLEAPWINFEAGALSKQQQNTYVCTFLFGLEPIDVREPLAQFQATKAEKEDVRKLINTINRVLSDNALPEGKINEAFDVWWPKLEERLVKIQEYKQSVMQINDNLDQPNSIEHQRDIREILSEILELVRSQSRANYPVVWEDKLTALRLPSTLDWSPEDAQLINKYYQHLKKDIKDKEASYTLEKLRKDEKFARLILRTIKQNRSFLAELDSEESDETSQNENKGTEE